MSHTEPEKPEYSFEMAVAIIGHHVQEYANWYAKAGMHLPKEYATNPSAWTNVLNEIAQAFDIAETKEYRDNPELEHQMKKGFELFGRYFTELWK